MPKGRGVTGGLGRTKVQTKSQRAGLQFNVGRILRHLREARIAPRVSPLAGVYLSATIEVCGTCLGCGII